MPQTAGFRRAFGDDELVARRPPLLAAVFAMADDAAAKLKQMETDLEKVAKEVIGESSYDDEQASALCSALRVRGAREGGGGAPQHPAVARARRHPLRSCPCGMRVRACFVSACLSAGSVLGKLPRARPMTSYGSLT